MKTLVWIAVTAGALVWAEPPRTHADTEKSGRLVDEAAPPPCSFRGVTQDCALFDASRRDFVAMPDGTRIPIDEARNKSRLSPEEEMEFQIAKDEAHSQHARKQREQRYQLANEAHLRLSETKGIAQSFKNFFVENLSGEFGEALLADTELKRAEIPRPDEIDGASLELPWPLDKEGAPFQSIPVAEARKALAEKLGPELTKQLWDISEKQYALLKEVPPAASTPPIDKLRKAKQEENALINSRLSKLDEIVSEVKKGLLEVMLQGRSEGEISESEKSIVKRIQLLKVTPPMDPFLQTQCRGPSTVNAFYSSTDHSINICPTLFMYPDESLITLIAHEVSHAFDPCKAQFPLYAVDSQKLFESVDPKSGVVKGAVRQDPERLHAFRLLLETTEMAPPPHRTGFPFAMEVEEKALTFFSEGKSPVLKLEAAGIPLDTHPFRKVMACLTGPGVGFASSRSVNLEPRLERLMRYRRQHQIDTPQDETEIKEAISRFPECGGGLGHSQVSEAFADWMGAEVLAKHLATQKLETPESRVAPVGWLAQHACHEKSVLRSRPRGTISTTLANMYSDLAASGDEHPIPAERIEKIFLRQPAYRKALGCEETKDYCSHQEGGSK